MKKAILLFLAIFAMTLTAQAKVNDADASTLATVTGRNYTRPVVIDFSATWCGPCQQYAPILNRVSNSFAGKILFYKVDVDNNLDLCGKYNINSVPTTIIIYNANGDYVRLVGLQDETTLKQELRKILKRQK